MKFTPLRQVSDCSSPAISRLALGVEAIEIISAV
jgi:hypothetical protein